MSAFVAVRKTDRVELMMDAAGVRADGTIGAIASKLVVLPNLRCAIGGRGPMLIETQSITTPANIYGAIASSFCTTFDEFVLAFDEVRNQAEPFCRAAFHERWDHDLVIGGWSQSRDRPETYYFATQALNPDQAAGVLHEGQPIMCSGTMPEWSEVVAAGWSNPESEDDFRPHVDGLAILNAMRGQAEPMWFTEPQGPLVFKVGGFAELVTIGREGASRSILHRWPDRVGEQLKP